MAPGSPALLPEWGSSPSFLHHTNSGLRAEVQRGPRFLGLWASPPSPSLSLSPTKTFPSSRASALFSAQLENNGAQLGAKLWPGVSSRQKCQQSALT